LRHAQALSAKFRHRLKIAVVSKAEKAIAKTLNVTAYPALRVLPAGSSAGSSEAVHFTGKVSLFSIDLFLMDYAKPAASSAPKEAAKGKAAAGEAKSKTKDEKSSNAKGASKEQEKAANAKGASKEQGKQAKPPSSGKSSTKETKTASAEPPVYGDPPKKNSRERRGGEL
jgi:hypothetical protein